jgi:hypothetical protein
MSTRRDLTCAGLAMAIAFLGAAAVLELWRADLRVPLAYGGDANLLHTFVKGIVEHGWYLENPSLGAPGEVDFHDYPVLMGNNLDVLLIRVLALGSSDSALVMNVFFLLTFPLVALTAYIALRVLGISSATAVACSALYALLPYHFFHGEVQPRWRPRLRLRLFSLTLVVSTLTSTSGELCRVRNASPGRSDGS